MSKELRKGTGAVDEHAVRVQWPEVRMLTGILQLMNAAGEDFRLLASVYSVAHMLDKLLTGSDRLDAVQRACLLCYAQG